MSHIDNALMKAQKERDGKGTRFSPVIPVPSATDTNRRGRWGILSTVVVVVALCAGLTFFLLQDRSPSEKEGPATSYRGAVVRQQEPSAQKTPPQAPPQGTGEKEILRPPPSIEGGESTQPAPVEPHTAAISEPVPRQETRSRNESNTARINTLYKRAVAYQKEDAVDRAEEVYREILRMVPEHLFSLNNLGVIYMLRGDSDAAAEIFQRAIRAKDDYVDPHYNLACLYAGKGETAPALDYLERAVRLNNDVKKWAKDDRDLSSLRGLPGYARVTGETTASTHTDLPIYIVREGDRIYDVIRREFGSSGSEAYRILTRIKQLNPTMEDSNMIFPGQRLNLPGTEEVGETAPPVTSRKGTGHSPPSRP